MTARQRSAETPVPPQPAPSFDVCVVYNDDAKLWPDFIKRQLSSSIRFRSLLDADVATANPPMADAKVIIVVVSFDHVAFLQESIGPAAYLYRDVDAERGMLFMCGVEECQMTEVVPWETEGDCNHRLCYRVSAEHFPRFSQWTRVNHDVESTELKRTVDRLMAAWTPPKFTLYPSVARSEVR